MTDTTSPSVRQRELGRQLRELRNQRGLTVEDVAEDLLWSTTKISRIETGARCQSLPDVRDLWARYGVDRPARARLMTLAREAREQGWWIEYDDLSFDPFSGPGDAAASESFMKYYVPGLLQTEEYARKIMDDIEPRMKPDVSQQRVKAGSCYDQLCTASNWRCHRIARE